MKISDRLAESYVNVSPHWREIKQDLSQANCASECVVNADDWTENVVFQLIRHDGVKTSQLVYTYHLFRDLSFPQLYTELKRLVEN